MGRHRLNYSSAYDGRRGALDLRNRAIPTTPEMLLTTEHARLIGARVRRLRSELDLTQAQTVDRVEHPRGGRYSTGLLSRIEHGWANAPLFVYLHIAEVLGVDPGDLLGPETEEDVIAAAMERSGRPRSGARRRYRG
jgi:transcriptional regulator with XRE-family HTH domain